MKHRPKILLTTSNICSPQLKPLTGDTELVYSDKATADAIIKAGGLPMYLPSISSLSDDDITRYLDLADGVLITGADSNVNPLYYGESFLPTLGTSRIDDERDKTDLTVVRIAAARKIPMLGICKGMQIINVALGGTLYQNVGTQHPGSLDHDTPKASRADFTHTITTAPGSLAEHAFGKGKARVNGGHQQAVRTLARALKPTAHADDGIVEMYEGTDDHSFIVGTQFHPELRTFDASFLRLFEHFITATTTPSYLTKPKEGTLHERQFYTL